MSKIFLLDANVFIEAKNRYYGFDLCPGFWNLLTQSHAAKRTESIDRVHDELVGGNDELVVWVKSQQTFFSSTNDSGVLASYAQLQTWAQSSQYSPQAKADFADGANADAWLIAYALAHHRVVATLEISQPDSKKRIRIPDVCNAFSTPYINTFDMLRELGAQFH